MSIQSAHSNWSDAAACSRSILLAGIQLHARAVSLAPYFISVQSVVRSLASDGATPAQKTVHTRSKASVCMRRQSLLDDCVCVSLSAHVSVSHTQPRVERNTSNCVHRRGIEEPFLCNELHERRNSRDISPPHYVHHSTSIAQSETHFRRCIECVGERWRAFCSSLIGICTDDAIDGFHVCLCRVYVHTDTFSFFLALSFIIISFRLLVLWAHSQHRRRRPTDRRDELCTPRARSIEHKKFFPFSSALSVVAQSKPRFFYTTQINVEACAAVSVAAAKRIILVFVSFDRFEIFIIWIFTRFEVNFSIENLTEKNLKK